LKIGVVYLIFGSAPRCRLFLS